jgi:hypothetical protein
MELGEHQWLEQRRTIQKEVDERRGLAFDTVFGERTADVGFELLHPRVVH